MAGVLLEASTEDIVLEADAARVAGTDRAIPFTTLARAAYHQTHLFKGEIWIDASTYLKVQESGYLVKNPSIWLKKVAFIRKYEIREGISVPRETQSVADTRLVGKAEMTIEFTNVSLQPKHAVAAEDAQ